ncbi:uncharacterized protein LOC143294839 [Babylonia areolata]|uniref:uncharacterized protein LOC143294839 n=1 Tax=Babylonia areolata TaxID=304850 RepID=UPI003FD21835
MVCDCSKCVVVCLLLLLLSVCGCFSQTTGVNHDWLAAPTHYNMADLLRLRSSALSKIRPRLDLPKELKPRRRGRKGGVRARNKLPPLGRSDHSLTYLLPLTDL